MMKAVILDVGSVIQGLDWTPVVNSLLDLRPDLSVKEYKDAFYYDRENYFDLYQVSRISSETFWRMVASRLNISKSNIGRLKESLTQLYSFVNVEVVEILKLIHGDYKLFILSNACPELENKLIKNNYHSIFDKMYFSHNICCRKPNKDSYQKVLEDNDLKPEECILIEDNQDNIESAKEMGINTLLARNNDSLKKELFDLLDGSSNDKREIIGYTTGVFDLFHIGHLNLLKNAKKHCDKLIVGLTTDELSLSFKNKTPIVPLAERMEIVRAIKYVDEVVIQENMDKFDAWKKYRFHVMFASGTPTAKWPRVEAEFMANFARDGLEPPEIIRLDYTPEVSSTSRREEVGK